MHIRDALINYIRYGLADKIQLELCSCCQLKCPVCSQAQGKTGIIGKGYVRFEDFRTLLDRFPHIRRIEVSNFGEIFLNPHFKDILQYAFKKRVELTAHNGVNLNTVDDEVLEMLVTCQFRHINIALDGTNNKTYSIYRIGGNFDTVINNIKKINGYKQHYGSAFPRLRWQFILFGHNEKELPVAREMADALGMEFEVKNNWSETYSPLKQNTRSNAENNLPTGICRQLWLSPQINWDGKILGCCINKWDDYGNAFETGLNLRKNERFQYAKKMLLGIAKEREDIPCTQCSVYHKMKKMNRYL